MDRYLEEIKKSDEIKQVIQNFCDQLQTNDITRHLTTRSHQKIIDKMLQYRLRDVRTYIRLAEMCGWCLGETTSLSDAKLLQQQFNIQVLQIELQKSKLKRQKIIRPIATPSTEVESVSERKQPSKSKFQKMQKVLQDVRARQTSEDLVKIEEYFQKKKVKKYQSLEGWVMVDQKRLSVPIDPLLIEKTMKVFTQCWKQFASEFT